MEGTVSRVVGVVALGEPPVLTPPPEASDVVCAPVDVEDPDGGLVEAPDDELVEDPDEESDDELDGSARASPCPESTAAPTPMLIIRPANRPMPRSIFLTTAIRTITTSMANENRSTDPRRADVGDPKSWSTPRFMMAASAGHTHARRAPPLAEDARGKPMHHQVPQAASESPQSGYDAAECAAAIFAKKSGDSARQRFTPK
jgi:hypothetical protein